MPILPHNQRAIDGLKPVDGKRTSYTSAAVVGLVLEVMPSGARSWRVRYRTTGGRRGKTRAYTIGDARLITLGQAVDKAREVLGAIQLEGRDPHAEKRRIGNTFGELVEAWLVRHAKAKKKSWKHDEEMYRRHVRARLGQADIEKIKRADIAAVLDDIAKSASGIQANRAQTLISAVFNWAVNEGRLEHSPAFRIPKRGVEVPRERVLNEAEIRAFWNGLASGPLGPTMERVLRLALLTGQRRSEIAMAPVAELDLSGPDPSWTIAGIRTKNSVMHRVPLTPMVAEIFAAAVASSETVAVSGKSHVGGKTAEPCFVLPGRGNYKQPIDAHAVTRAMSRVVKDLGIAHATVHDLRRTVGTHLARLGVSKDIRARILNHVDGARSVTDAVYNQHEFWAEKRAALMLWEGELHRIVEPSELPNSK